MIYIGTKKIDVQKDSSKILGELYSQNKNDGELVFTWVYCPCSPPEHVIILNNIQRIKNLQTSSIMEQKKINKF